MDCQLEMHRAIWGFLSHVSARRFNVSIVDDTGKLLEVADPILPVSQFTVLTGSRTCTGIGIGTLHNLQLRTFANTRSS